MLLKTDLEGLRALLATKLVERGLLSPNQDSWVQFLTDSVPAVTRTFSFLDLFIGQSLTEALYLPDAVVQTLATDLVLHSHGEHFLALGDVTATVTGTGVCYRIPYATDNHVAKGTGGLAGGPPAVLGPFGLEEAKDLLRQAYAEVMREEANRGIWQFQMNQLEEVLADPLPRHPLTEQQEAALKSYKEAFGRNPR